MNRTVQSFPHKRWIHRTWSEMSFNCFLTNHLNHSQMEHTHGVEPFRTSLKLQFMTSFGLFWDSSPFSGFKPKEAQNCDSIYIYEPIESFFLQAYSKSSWRTFRSVLKETELHAISLLTLIVWIAKSGNWILYQSLDWSALSSIYHWWW